MARIRVFVVLVIALTAGRVLAFATYNYVQNAPAKTVNMPTHPVVVAAANLELGAELTRDDLRVIDWPAGFVPEGTFSDPKEIIGRGVIVPLVANEAILPMKLASKEAGAGLTPAIPPGLRAVSVRVNEVIGVAGYVTPGTRVDVVATVNPTTQQQDITSKVILTDVQVLAAGTKIESRGDQEKPMPVTVVTLLVDPQEAERLTLASNEGKIQLALRNPLDKDHPATPGVKPALLLGATPTVRAVSTRRVQGVVAAVPEPLPTVEIIRGDKRVRETVHGQE